MSQVPPEQDRVEPPTAEAEERYGLVTNLVYAVEDKLAAEKIDEVAELVADLHDADVAALLQTLGRLERERLIEILGTALAPGVLPCLNAAVRQEVIDQIGPHHLARLLSALDIDHAVQVFDNLDAEFQHRILSELPQVYRQLLEESLSYPEESAGRLMQRDAVVVPSVWTLGETIDYLRGADDLPDDFYDLYIVNPKHHPIGYIPLSRALRTRRPVPLTEIMERDMKVIPLTMDQEEVAYIFAHYGLISAPVVDEDGRLAGVVTAGNVVRVVNEVAQEDFMKLAGVKGADLFSAPLHTTKSRAPWLLVNLATAILASVVIGLFEATIGQLVALAVLMPIVASMGGNAGTQTLTVAVRALAMKDLTEANVPRFVRKEVLIGAVNGSLFAVLVGLVVWLWFSSPALGAVIAAAMIVNMIVAGLFGTLIPIGLNRLGIDPAIASGIFVTTVTDVVGFISFLGLAALFLI
ncbi:MAG: magnesium transporter [Kiloniellales bacterium]